MPQAYLHIYSNDHMPGGRTDKQWVDKVNRTLHYKNYGLETDNPDFDILYKIGQQLEEYLSAICNSAEEPIPGILFTDGNESIARANSFDRVIEFNSHAFKLLSQSSWEANCAHEMGHIKLEHGSNLAFMQFAAITLALPILLAATSATAFFTGEWTNSFMALASLYTASFVVAGIAKKHMEHTADEFGASVIGKSKMIDSYNEAKQLRRPEAKENECNNLGACDDLMTRYFSILNKILSFHDKIFYPKADTKIKFLEKLEESRSSLYATRTATG